MALCPKKALAEGPLPEITKGMDAPPVLRPGCLRLLRNVCQPLPGRAFKMTVKEKVPDTGKNATDNIAEDVPLTETARRKRLG